MVPSLSPFCCPCVPAPPTTALSPFFFTARHLFKKEVFEPLCLSVDVKDQQFAQFVEHVIPSRDMTAFVVQTQEDQKLLLSELNDKQNLYINCVADPGQMPAAVPLPAGAADAGIVGTITDMIEAPLPVKRYICYQV